MREPGHSARRGGQGWHRLVRGLLVAPLVMVGAAEAQTTPPEAAVPPALQLAGPTVSVPLFPKTSKALSIFSVDSSLLCPGCGGDSNTTPSNPNAPWTALARFRVGGARAALTAVVTAQRGATAPLYIQGPIDAGVRTVPVSWVAMDDTRTSWHVVLRAERTVKRYPGGATVSVYGELFSPLGVTGESGRRGVTELSQAALSMGVRIGW